MRVVETRGPPNGPCPKRHLADNCRGAAPCGHPQCVGHALQRGMSVTTVGQWATAKWYDSIESRQPGSLSEAPQREPLWGLPGCQASPRWMARAGLNEHCLQRIGASALPGHPCRLASILRRCGPLRKPCGMGVLGSSFESGRLDAILQLTDLAIAPSRTWRTRNRRPVSSKSWRDLPQD